MAQVPTVTLNNGVPMPQLGFGVFQVPNDEVIEPVKVAIDAGYRSIDTAAIYGNEDGVATALAESGVARSELFVTTKLWNDQQGYDSTLRAHDESLRKLKLDYVDLYLIHWPQPARDEYVPSWRALEKLYADGKIKAIGVSNFHVPHLERLFAETDIVPAVNQIELHPNLPQAQLREFHAKHEIATEAWSPLGQGKGLLNDPTLGEVAAKHGRTPAQVALRWSLQLGNIVIPKSATPERIRSNVEVFDFELTDADMATISGLDNGTRVGPDPDQFG